MSDTAREDAARRDHGTVTEAGAIQFRRVLPGPIGRVWDYLTDPDKRAAWLAGGPMELRVGGLVRLDFRHADLSPRPEPVPERYRSLADGVSQHGRVTACEPPRLLAYTWGEDGGAESEVTFALTERPDGVLLVLTHRRLPDRAATVSVLGGWHTHLGILADRLAGREPAPFWSTHAPLEEEYGSRIGEP